MTAQCTNILTGESFRLHNMCFHITVFFFIRLSYNRKKQLTNGAELLDIMQLKLNKTFDAACIRHTLFALLKKFATDRIKVLGLKDWFWSILFLFFSKHKNQ